MNYITDTNTMEKPKSEMMMELAKNWVKPKPVVVPKVKRSKFDGCADVIRYLRAGKKLSWKQVHQFFNENGIQSNYNTLMNYVKDQHIGGMSHKKRKKK